MPPRGKVLLAMSGGVDSSVAAALLLREGFDVVGCFMRLGSPGETLDEFIPDCPTQHSALSTQHSLRIGHQGCCSITDAADARAVAAQLGIPFYVCNFKKDFGRVIDYFVDEYASGRTPNPCVRCNDWLKFGKLHDYAGQIGAQYVASGHYARVESGRLLRGLDRSKDQSYVLFGIPREQLASTLLPIGNLRKPAVRELARQFKLPVSDKPDSQEICFVPDNDYAALVERRRPELVASGAVRDESGREVGQHAGHHRYTVGQRRGVGIAQGRRLYVIQKDPGSNTVTIGPPERLEVASCIVGEMNVLSPGPLPERCLAMYRSNGRLSPARVRAISGAPDDTPSGRRARCEVHFEHPQRAVAPGQALVLYDAQDPDLVLGGGWIRSTTAPSA